MSAAPTLGRATQVEPLAVPAEAAEARRLYELHSRRVFAYCLSQLRNPEDAEDAAQTTFVNAIRGLQRGVRPELESAWLLAIARNVCLTRWDSARRRSRLEVVRDPHVLEEVAPAVEHEAEEAIPFRDALASLSDQQREAIVLREWHGLAYREIATQLELSQSAVESLIFRARRSLAQALERDGRGRLRSLDFAALLAQLKSLFAGGSAVKLAALAAAAATATLAATELSGATPERARAKADLASPPASSIARWDSGAPEEPRAVTDRASRSEAPKTASKPAPPAASTDADGETQTASSDPVSPVTEALPLDVPSLPVEAPALPLPDTPDLSSVVPQLEVPSVELPEVPLP